MSAVSILTALSSLRRIKPAIVQRSESILRINVTRPQAGDWILAALIIAAGYGISKYTSPTPLLFYVSLGLFVILAVTLIEDSSDLVIDMAKNEVQIRRSSFGITKRVMACPADELISVGLALSSFDPAAQTP
eukprot:jgi/Hompol1/5084/HPOL_004163-RA